VGGHSLAIGGELSDSLPALAGAAADVPGSMTRAVFESTIRPLLSSNRVNRLIRRGGPPALSQGSQKLYEGPRLESLW